MMKNITILFALALLAACQSNQAKDIDPNEPNVAVDQEPPPTPPQLKPITRAWDFSISRNAAKESMTLDSSQGKITLTAGAETDFFTEPGEPPYDKANAPLLLHAVDNTQPFTFSFKTTPEHKVKYDAGMAFIYLDDHHWLKFAFEADERMKTRMVTVKTADFSDDNNHDVVPSPTAYLKISSNTKVIGFYYSVDGKDWQLVRVFKNEYPAQIMVGIGTQSPAGKGNQSVFEDFDFRQESVKDFRMGV